MTVLYTTSIMMDRTSLAVILGNQLGSRSRFESLFSTKCRYQIDNFRDLIAATELLYVMYIGSVARNRMSKKLERLLSVMLLPIIPVNIPATGINR